MFVLFRPILYECRDIKKENDIKRVWYRQGKGIGFDYKVDPDQFSALCYNVIHYSHLFSKLYSAFQSYLLCDLVAYAVTDILVMNLYQKNVNI